MATIIEEIYCPACGWKPNGEFYKKQHMMRPEKCTVCGHLLKSRIVLEKAP